MIITGSKNGKVRIFAYSDGEEVDEGDKVVDEE
jgi:hypothetical protein